MWVTLAEWWTGLAGWKLTESRSQIQGEVRRLWIPAKLAYGETAEEWQASNSVMLSWPLAAWQNDTDRLEALARQQLS